MRQLQLLKKLPKEDMNAAEDFLEIITRAHVIAAAMTFFTISSWHESCSYGLEEVHRAATEDKPKVFLRCIRNMLKEQLLITSSERSTKSDDKVLI